VPLVVPPVPPPIPPSPPPDVDVDVDDELLEVDSSPPHPPVENAATVKTPTVPATKHRRRILVTRLPPN